MTDPQNTNPAKPAKAKRAQGVYTLLVQVGRKEGDGLPDKATGAGLMIYASGVDEAEAVRETVAILKEADLAVLEVEGLGTKADGKLIRTLTIQGQVPENAWFRLAQGAKIEAKDGGFIVDAGRFDLSGQGFENRFRIMAPGATLAGSNLVLPVKAGSIKVTYQWLQ